MQEVRIYAVAKKDETAFVKATKKGQAMFDEEPDGDPPRPSDRLAEERRRGHADQQTEHRQGAAARAAQEREPHRVTAYLEELARLAHAWYHHCRVLGEAPVVEHARLVLARAARIVLGNGLALLGLRAPDRM